MSTVRPSWLAITIDCREPERVAAFWGRLLDAPVRSLNLSGWFRLGPVTEGGPHVSFQPVLEPKSSKTRIHFDVRVEDLELAMSLVEELGGASTGQVHAYDEGTVAVMTDVEGNEFCLVRFAPGVDPD